ncbi:MAG: adenylate kinase [Pirellulales bacterium]
MRLVFLGPPGAGKGTQSARLTGYLSIPHLSTGDMLRKAIEEQTPVGRMVAEYLDSGRLVPDPVIIQVVGNRLRQPDCKPGCLFDGFPRTLGQAQALDEYLASLGTPLAGVIHLDVPEEKLVKRLMQRGRGDDHPETIRRRFEQYKALTAPLLEYYGQRKLLHTVDASSLPDEVFKQLKVVVDRLAQERASGDAS